LKEKIVDWLKQKKYRTSDSFQLARDLKIKDTSLLQKNLVELENEGIIVKNKQGKFGLIEKMGYVKGVLDLKQAGYGFLIVEDRESDVFIPGNKTLNAYNKDLCLVKIISYRSETKTEGEIVKVLKRNLERVVGEYYQGAIFPKNPPFGVFFKVINKPKGIVDHSYVEANIVKYAKSNILDCEIVNVFGHKDDPGIEIIEVVKRHDIPYDFLENVLSFAQSIPDHVETNEFTDRLDLREELIFTIDGDDTKDIDDAISINKLANGNYELGVHIADVSHYVQEDSMLDKEAYLRGTSVYLADRVIPMLPRNLSNGICSLNPKVERLSLSCIMEINGEAEVIDYKIVPSVIKSFQQLTYSETNKILAKEASEKIVDETVIQKLFMMDELAKILFQVRTEIGSINFETIEPKIMVDTEGNVFDILIRERGVSEKIIEEFMLVANQVVATDIFRKQLPFIFRIHEKPDMDKLNSLFLFAKELKYIDYIPKKIKRKDLQKLLFDVEDSKYEKVINTLMLRSMAKAKYSETNLGHYGLAFTEYTHFTSPIRRYPDLMVHRMLRSYVFEQNTEEASNHFQDILPDIALWTSKTERRAMIAEREVDDMKKAEYMEHHIGEVFEGVISSLMRFGMFVELPNTVEGLVHISTFNEAIEFDEEKMFYLGISSRMVYNIGMKVNVKLVKADKLSGKIDFTLV